MMSLVRGISVALFLFFTSYLGTIFMQGPFFWLIFVSPSAFRTWIDSTMTMWMKFTGTMLQWIGGIKVRQFGECIRPRERAIFLLNHRTRLDFMYFWATLSRFGTCYQEKIILKDGLNKIPGAGWAMQAAGFIFLSRKWQKDQFILTDFVKYFYISGQRPQILIFPEGTDMCPFSRERSNAYAEKNDLPKYEYVLHPRTTGFFHLLQRMQVEGGIEAVYDITVAYPSNFPTSEPELVSGNIPPEVHYHIKRYDIHAIDPNSLKSQWLPELWADKEKQLAEYYNGQKIFNNELFSETSIFVEISLFAYWILFIVLALYFIYSSWIVFLYFIFANLFCIYYSSFKGGFQNIYMQPALSDFRRED